MNGTLTDGSVLRAFGVELERDAAQVAHPVACEATPIVWRRCAWHGGILGVIALEQPSAGMFTDTICPACREKFFARQAAGGQSERVAA